MKDLKPFIISLLVVFGLSLALTSHAAPTVRFEQNIYPFFTNAFDFGTSTKVWSGITTNKLWATSLSGSGTRCVQVDNNGMFAVASDACGTGSGGAGGGLGTTTPWTTGNLVRVVNNSSVTSIATSSLGLGVSSFLSPNISQWTNDAGYSAFAWPFTRQADLSQGTTTVMSFLGGFYSSASSTLGNTNASTTVAGSLHVGINTSKQNLLSVTAPSGTQFASSDSVGGLTNITNTNNGGSGLLVYTNGGAIRTNDLVRIKSDNILGDQRSLSISHDGVASAMLVDCNNATRNVGAECFNLTDEVGANRTAFGVSGAPIGLGLLKFTINSGSDSSASALSMQLDDTDVQGFFGDTVAGYTGKLLNLRVDGVEKLTLTTNGAVFNASTTLQNFTGINSTTTNSTTTDLHISSDLNFGGVSGSAWSTFCTAITGGAGLCDGNDATGGGGATFAYPFTTLSTGEQATSTTLALLNGFVSTASSTVLSLKVSDLSTGRIPYTSTGGLLVTGANLQFNDTLGRITTTQAQFTDATTTNATTTNLRVSSDINFGGVVGNSWDDFCVTITGSAGLCDGDDATGAGGGTPYPFPLATNATSSTVGFFGGLLSTASSTFTGSTTLATTLMTNATSTNLAVTNGFAVSGITSAIPLTNAVGEFAEYAGTSCTNQFVRSLSALGVATCATVANTDLANSTISGIALGSNLADLTATDSTLTFSGTYNGSTARTIGLNLGNANSWTALQSFTNTDSILATGSTTLQNFTGRNATTTNFSVTSNSLMVGGNNHITATTTSGFRVASTTLDARGISFSTGTTSIQIATFPEARTLTSLYCVASSTGSVRYRIGDGTNWANTNSTSCSTTGARTYFTTTNTFTADETVVVEIGTSATSPSTVTLSPTWIKSAP